jgi:hypothetical protein
VTNNEIAPPADAPGDRADEPILQNPVLTRTGRTSRSRGPNPALMLVPFAVVLVAGAAVYALNQPQPQIQPPAQQAPPAAPATPTPVASAAPPMSSTPLASSLPQPAPAPAATSKKQSYAEETRPVAVRHTHARHEAAAATGSAADASATAPDAPQTAPSASSSPPVMGPPNPPVISPPPAGP